MRASRWTSRRIRFALACVLAVAGLALAAPAADAQKVRKERRKSRVETQVVTYATPLKQRPGEAAETLVELAVGDEVEVMGRKGRWVRVRVRGRLGWVTRTTIAASDREGESWGDDASTEDADPIDLIAMPDATDASADLEADRDPDGGPDRARARLGHRGLELAAEAGLGLSTYSRQFSSDGASALGGYRVTAGSMAASASGLARIHIGVLFVAARASYATSIGVPGIRFQNEDGEVSEPNGFQIHRVLAAVELGATLGQSHPVRIAAKAGYRVGYFVLSDVQENPGLLARERLSGLEIGVNASTAISREILVSADLSWIPSASLDQTVNLEDGMESEVWAISGGARASYLIDDRNAIDVGYQGRRVKYDFSGQSTRQFDVTSARRKDIHHAFVVGVARAFQ